MSASDTAMWQTVRARDADALLRRLGAVGFTEHAVYRDDNATQIPYAERLWPGGGGVTLST